MVDLQLLRVIILAIVFTILFSIEYAIPFFQFGRKLRHVARNITISLINTILLNLSVVSLLFVVTDTSWGLFNQLQLPGLAELLLTILIIDLLTYWMHVAFHKIPFLWKFHRMHHSDTKMDVSTGVRFHIGEHLITIAVRYSVFAIFAMQLEFILIYEIIFIANVLLHHANITFTERVDRVYRLFLTSPNMHKVHHSNYQPETDSNYTSILSVWDRLFRSYTIVTKPKNIVFGIEGLEQEQSVGAMLLTPWKRK